ncbi:MAG: endonuclease/exonuclease/phosphatase family protein [Deltaproteobacteria bacterium]|nr:endonuclease/exonuclease/phosphatase family protein [Deltaproteobacteria bacterium]
MSGFRLKVLSYNIHKGFTASNLSFALHRIKSSIDLVHADLVFLQEVLGHHEHHGRRHKDWPTAPQFEFLAGEIWPHFAYGKNAAYAAGHHGNAILSKYPITSWENIDISTNRLERRGMLHATVQLPRMREELHAVCVHLDLLASGRATQIAGIIRRVEKAVPHDAPLVLAGDFNDWGEKASRLLQKNLGLNEAFLALKGEHARTFPSWLPVLRLDRIYYRGAEAVTAEILSNRPWNELSDHAAVSAELVRTAKNK